MTCEKCGLPLKDCPDCKGTGGQTAKGGGGFFGDLTCSTCNSTGKLCPEHGKYWQKP
jgi:DnaJ-class molecular chaperone